MGTILITDASVLINLVASGAAEEILSGCGMEFKICPVVIRKVKALRARETGEEHAIDLEPFFTAGTLERIEPQTDLEFELLIDYAGLLGAGDGEAMCFALAESRGHPIAIDDERAIRRAKKRNPNFETFGTLEILILWQERNGSPDEQMGQLLQSILQFARFQPARSPLFPHYPPQHRCHHAQCGCKLEGFKSAHSRLIPCDPSPNRLERNIPQGDVGCGPQADPAIALFDQDPGIGTGTKTKFTSKCGRRH